MLLTLTLECLSLELLVAVLCSVDLLLQSSNLILEVRLFFNSLYLILFKLGDSLLVMHELLLQSARVGVEFVHGTSAELDVSLEVGAPSLVEIDLILHPRIFCLLIADLLLQLEDLVLQLGGLVVQHCHLVDECLVVALE